MVGCPIIGINDSAGARIQDAVTSLAWYAELGRRARPVARTGAADLASSSANALGERSIRRSRPISWSRCATRATCSSPVPDVIKDVTGEDVSLDELGGADAQARYGNIHQVVEDEAAAFQYVRDFLSFLPPNASTTAPVVNPGLEPEITPSDLELDSIVPDCRQHGLRHARDPAAHLRRRRRPRRRCSARTGHHHRVRPGRRSTGRCDGQPADVHVGCDRQRGLRQGGPASSGSATPTTCHWFSSSTPLASCRASSRRRAASSSAAADSSTRSSRPTCRR